MRRYTQITCQGLFLCAVAISFACGAKQLAYVGRPSMTREDARAVVLKTIETQQRPFAPAEVSVSEEKIEVVVHHVRRSMWSWGVTSVLERTVVYFEDIGRTHWFERDS